MKNSKYTRRNFIKTMAASTSATLLPSFFIHCNRSNKRPNIIFIMTDDHAYQAIGCYGSKINKTPHIDRLANEGVRFTHSFCTNSICAPSRAVLLTGKYSHINGQIDNSTVFDGEQMTFPKLLREAGYETAIIGKWHLKSDPTGFDYWNILPGQGDYYNPDFIEMGMKKNYTGYVTDLTTDISLHWLKQRKSEKPFCLLLHHKAPHRNWMPNLKHLNLYEDIDIPMPETFYDDYNTRSAAAREQEMSITKDMDDAWDFKIPPQKNEQDFTWLDRLYADKMKRLNAEQLKLWDAAYKPRNEALKQAKLNGQALDRWKYQRYIKDYLRCIVSVDENIGRILDYLDESGLTENTIVIYTSDQGFYLGEHGWFDKRFMYEESLRMPLIVRYPQDINSGSINDDMVLNLDFAPTFLDYAGVNIPKEIQGYSLRPLLMDKKHPVWRDSIYYHYYEYPGAHSVKRHYGIRTRRYKLIHFYYDIDAWELYDLQKDPHEMNNVSDDPAYSEIVSQLKKQLDVLRQKYGDSDELTRDFLEKNEHGKK